MSEGKAQDGPLRAPLVRQVLLEPVPISIWGQAWVLLVPVFLLDLVLMMAFNGSVVLFTVLFVILFVLALGGGGFVILARRTERALSKEVIAKTKSALEAYAGLPLQAADYSVAVAGKRGLAGSAIAWDGKAIYVVDRGEVVRIPPPLVREWRWEITGSNRVQTFGSVNTGTQLQVQHANMDASAAAYATSGLFVTVADVGKPVWQFTSRNRADLERWHEVLHQLTEQPGG